MAKFRAKRIEVEAIQFIDTAENIEEISTFVDDQDLVVSYRIPDEPVLKVIAGEQLIMVQVGQWLIKQEPHCYSVMDSYDFAISYEEVDG